MSIAENIIRLREQHGLTQRELGEIAGVTDKAVSTWELGVKAPRMGAVARMAAHFGIPKSAILDDAPTATPFAAVMDRLCAAWGRSPERVERDLDFPHGRMVLLRRGEATPTAAELDVIAAYFHVPIGTFFGEELPAEPSNVRPAPVTSGRRIPVLGRIPAGNPMEAVEEIIDEIDLDSELAEDGNTYFALYIQGDSMYPEYREGDVVIIRAQETAETGDDVVAYIGGTDATFKRLMLMRDGLRLCPINPQYPTRTFTGREVESLPVTVGGIAIELRRRRKK